MLIMGFFLWRLFRGEKLRAARSSRRIGKGRLNAEGMN